MQARILAYTHPATCERKCGGCVCRRREKREASKKQQQMEEDQKEITALKDEAYDRLSNLEELCHQLNNGLDILKLCPRNAKYADHKDLAVQVRTSHPTLIHAVSFLLLLVHAVPFLPIIIRSLVQTVVDALIDHHWRNRSQKVLVCLKDSNSLQQC